MRWGWPEDPDRRTGFTLVELLVVLGLIAVLTGILVTIFYQFWRIPRWGNAQMTVDSDLRNAAMWLIRDGNQSRAFVPAGACGTFQTGHGDRYTYTLSGESLQRIDSSGGTVTVARHVQAISCTTDGEQVFVTLQVAVAPVSARETYTMTMRVE